MMANWTVLALLALVAIGGIGAKRWIDSANAQQPVIETGQEGRVRLIVRNPDVEATLTELISLAKEAGWTDYSIEPPNKLTLVPPNGYSSEAFGTLLQMLEKAKSRDWGLQLLDSSGRAIGLDGKPVK